MSSSFVERGALLFALVVPFALHAQATTGTLRGRVTDAASGRGIPEVQVTIGGTRLGVVTGQQGEFSLTSVPTGSRALEVRRIGYQPVERTLNVTAGDNDLGTITLNVSAVNLSEVVVTGTGTATEKRAVGTSIATVDSALISRAEAVTIDQAMQGKIPGAQITQNSGSPGGGGISVRLRGTNSFISGSDPLYIVDGVIVDNGSAQLADLGIRSNPQNRLADLNPDDIEHIEVTRGAAAAALYGSRANNGVVQIFTKRGTIGKAHYTASTRFSESELREQQPFNFYPFNEAGLPVQRYNYQDYIFRQAPANEQNLTVEGGNDQTRYYISGNYAFEDGIMKSTSSQRSGARINIQQQLASRLIGNVSANYVTTHNELQAFGEQNDYGIMGSLFFAPTNVNFFPTNGIYPLPPSLGTNPLLAIDRIRNPQQVDRFIGSTKLTWTPLTNVLFDYTLGIDNTGFEQRQFVPRNAVLGTAPLATGRSQSVFQASRVINQDGVSSYTWNPLGPFDLRTTAGFNHTSQRIRTTSATANGLAPVGDLVSAGSVFSAGQTDVELRTLGFYGQQEVAWRNKLFLSGGVRYDASSTFAPSERWQAFPLRLGLGGEPTERHQCVLAVHHLLAVALRRPAGLRQQHGLRESQPAQRARARMGSRHGRRLPRGTHVGRGDVLQSTRVGSALLPSAADEHRLLAAVCADRFDVEQGSRASAPHAERRRADGELVLDNHLRAQQEPCREPGHPGLPVGGWLSEPDSRRLPGGRVLRLVRRARLRHRSISSRFVRPLSPQQPDGRHGRDPRRPRGAQPRYLQ
jgi:TonB-dependent SusC/RagA subfamily outer membrane receptor